MTISSLWAIIQVSLQVARGCWVAEEGPLPVAEEQGVYRAQRRWSGTVRGADQGGPGADGVLGLG